MILRFAECKAQQNPAGVSHIQQKDTTHFENQGDQERYWTKQYFLLKYKLQHYDKYKGKVAQDEHSNFLYGNDSISVVKDDPILKAILLSGLLYPKLFSEFLYVKSPRVTLDDIEELPQLSTSPKVKRFKYLLWPKGMLNPSVYLIEITNNNANNKTSLINFIKEAELTFLAQSWIQI
jgi:hypothetical protein